MINMIKKIAIIFLVIEPIAFLLFWAPFSGKSTINPPSGDCNIITHYDIKLPKCGDSSGVVTVSILGGCAPYTYAWSDDAMTMHSTVSDLAAGDYYLTITDSLGCEKIDTVELMDYTKIYQDGLMPFFAEPREVGDILQSFYDFVDWNEDGLLDMFMARNDGGQLYLYQNAGLDFQLVDSLDTPPFIRSPFYHTTSRKQVNTHYNDFNADGVDDLLMSCANLNDCTADTVRIYWGQPSGKKFIDTVFLDIQVSDSGCLNGYGWDYDADSDLDVFVNQDDVALLGVNVYEATMDTFLLLSSLSFQPNFMSDFYDYNGDGKLDVNGTMVGQPMGRPGFEYYEGQGDGLIASGFEQFTFLDIQNFLTIHANPLTDNFYDIVFNSMDDGNDMKNIYLVSYDGSSNNWVYDSIVADSATQLMNILDFNQDGFDDIVFNYPLLGGQYQVNAFISDGMGAFSGTQNVGTFSFEPLKVLDFDGGGFFKVIGHNDDELIVMSLCIEPVLSANPMMICPGDLSTLSINPKGDGPFEVTWFLMTMRYPTKQVCKLKQENLENTRLNFQKEHVWNQSQPNSWRDLSLLL